MIAERIGAAGVSTDLAGSGPLGGGPVLAACWETGEVSRRGGARWPVAQRAGDKPLRIVAGGQLVAEPELDPGAGTHNQGLAGSGAGSGASGPTQGAEPGAAARTDAPGLGWGADPGGAVQPAVA